MEDVTPQVSVKKADTPLGSITKKASFLSIKGTLHSTPEKLDNTSALDSSEREKDDFTEEDVKIFWNRYLENLKKKHFVLFNVLNTTVCKVKEKDIIFFEFPSNSAYDEFENLKEDFFQKLKKHLNNYSVSFNYQIKESQKNILLTTKDKYEKMVKVNPLLEKLKNDFRLDI